VMEFLRKGVLTKRQTINGQGQELVTTEINLEHPLVIKALPGAADDLPEATASGDEDDNLTAGEDDVDTGPAGVTAAVVESWASSPEPSRYQRRFSSGAGAWRGRSNVRNGSRPEER